MSLPLLRRRVKVAPKYVGISLDASTVVVPKTVRANTVELRKWRSDPPQQAFHKPSSEQLTTAFSESENDSEASTSEEEQDTDMGSEDETDHEPTTPTTPKNYTLKALGLASELSDVVFERRIEIWAADWTQNQLIEHRKVVVLGRAEDDGAISLWEAGSEDASTLSISSLVDPDNRKLLVTLHDFQRLLGFIVGSPLGDPVKKRLHKLLDANGWRALKQPDSALSKSINQLRSPPNPVLRRTSQLWVLAWDQLEEILIRILEADGVCTTVLS